MSPTLGTFAADRPEHAPPIVIGSQCQLAGLAALDALVAEGGVLVVEGGAGIGKTARRLRRTPARRAGQPLTTPIGASWATRRASPARSTTSTTPSTSL